MTEIFYATRGMHWCNKKIEMKIEVLIIHSSCYPSKRAYVKLASQGGGEIENSKSLVLHVHTQGTQDTSGCTHMHPNHCMASQTRGARKRLTVLWVLCPLWWSRDG
jgi:hypothetical protein